MKVFSNISAFLVAAMLATTAACAQDPAPWQEAARLMKARDYQGALVKLDQQLKKTPSDLLTLRLKGMCLIELNRAPEALPVLEQALKVDPKSTACRFYLARAEVESGNINHGVALLKQVQADEPASAYADRARELLPSLENLATAVTAVGTLEPQRRWHFQQTVAGEYDDNVNNSAHQRIGSMRLTTTSALDVRFLDEVLDQAPVTVGLNYDFYRSFHERSAANDYDYENHGAAVYIGRRGALGDKPADIRLSGGYSHDWLGSDDYSDHFDVVLSGGVQYAPWAYVGLKTHGQWIDYKNQLVPHSLNARDGDNQSVGLEHLVYLFNNRWIIGVEYLHSWFNTQGRLFELNGDTVGVTSEVILPWEVVWRAGFRYTHDAYDIYQPPPDRIDNAYTFSTGFSRTLGVKWLSADLRYLHVMSASSKDFGDFHRNVVSLGLRYNF